MLKLTLIPCVFGILLTCWSQRNLTSNAKTHTDVLCSPLMDGRGYVNNGCNKAGFYLLQEFERIGLVPMNGCKNQPFYINVNRFPGACKIRINGTKKIPGIDYLIHPSSAPFHGKLSLTAISAEEILNLPYKSMPPKQGIAFIQPKQISRDTLLMVRAKLEKLARIQVPVVEYTHSKLTWSVSSEQFMFPYIQVFDTSGPIRLHKLKIKLNAELKENYEVSNILGVVKSMQPSDSFIIVSAHYDHLGRMGKNTYFPGANDNASGVAMLLSLAEEIQQQPLLKHNVLFIAFAGEEIGLLGSQFFVNQRILDLKLISCVLNLDIMGSGEEGITVVNGAIHKELFERLINLNELTESVSVIKARGQAANSDHYPFSKAGIPAIFIYTMGPNKNYHDIHDKASALSFDRFDQLHYLLLRFLQSF